MFMRVCPLFPALHVYPSDMTRAHPTRAGIEGLRHKSRHKIPAHFFTGTPYRCDESPHRSLCFSRVWATPSVGIAQIRRTL
jgi:hypothetical protein